MSANGNGTPPSLRLVERENPFAYYERDGTRISIDLDTPEGREKMNEIWSQEYRRVAQDYVGDVHVSTVFLPIDHGWGGGAPLIFETMVFGYDPRSLPRRLWDSLRGRHSWISEYQWRYSSEVEALASHRVIVDAVRNGRLDRLVV